MCNGGLQQRRGNSHIPSQQRLIDLQLRSQLREECQQRSHICVTQAPSSSPTTWWNSQRWEEHPTTERTTSMARTTRLAWMAVMGRTSTNFLNCQSHFANFFSSLSIFCWKFCEQTLASIVHAPGSEDRTPHRTQHKHICLVAHHVAQLFCMLRFIQCTCIG